ILANTRGLTVSSTANPNSAERGEKRPPAVAAEESRFHPGNFAPIGLEHTNFIVRQARAWSLTTWTTTSVLGRFPLSDPSLEHPGCKQVARFDALVFQLRKRHRSPIRMKAPTHDFPHFRGNLLQAFLLARRQTHSLNLHVEGSLPSSPLGSLLILPGSADKRHANCKPRGALNYGRVIKSPCPAARNRYHPAAFICHP